MPTKQPKLAKEEVYDITPQELTADQFFSLIEKAEKSGNQNLQVSFLRIRRSLDHDSNADFLYFVVVDVDRIEETQLYAR